MRRRSRSRFRSREVFRRPSILEPTWQGAPLAFEQLEDLLERIRHSLQPPRADIIDHAVRTALRVVDLLEDFWESMPPGTSPFTRAAERRSLPAVSPWWEEEEEEEERERRRERDEDEDRDRDDDDDDDDWEPVRVRDRRRRRYDEDEEDDYRKWRRQWRP